MAESQLEKVLIKNKYVNEELLEIALPLIMDGDCTEEYIFRVLQLSLQRISFSMRLIIELGRFAFDTGIENKNQVKIKNALDRLSKDIDK